MSETIAASIPDAWDRLEGIPDPLETNRLAGHTGILDYLAGLYASRRLHHGWLITGPRGIGKATLAARFAGHVLRNPDPASAPPRYTVPSIGDTTERLVASVSHPNLLVLRRPWSERDKRFRAELTVDEIRRMTRFFSMSAGTAGWRVAIIDSADDLNRASSNALLKMLEEPPPHALILLLAHSGQGMPATIRSRCQRLNLRPLSREEMSEALAMLGVSQEMSSGDLERLIALSGGSVRRALVILLHRGIELERQLADARAFDGEAIHRLADEIAGPGKEQRYRLLLELAQEHIGRRIRNAVEDRNWQGQEISVLARWVEVWENIRQSADRADSFNLDRKQVVLNLFAALREVA